MSSHVGRAIRPFARASSYVVAQLVGVVRLLASVSVAKLLVVIAVLTGVSLLVAPDWTLRVALTLALGVALLKAPVRYLVGALLFHLPFLEFLLTLVPARDVAFVRYAPEIALYVLVAALVVARGRLLLARLGTIGRPLALFLLVWTATAIWNYLPVTTMAIGFRSQFRFWLLLAVPLVSRSLARDARFYARVIAAAATIETLIVALQFVGGPTVRAWFQPNWDVVVGGILVAGGGSPGLNTVFGTLGDRNALGIFLVFAWIVVSAAGARGLGVPRAAAVALSFAVAGGVVLSGSRQAGLALIVAATALVLLRWWRLRSVRIAVAALTLATVVASAALVAAQPSPESAVAEQVQLDSPSLVDRWRSVFTASAWSPSTNSRLAFVDASVEAVSDTPIFGFGVGSVTDRRKLFDGTNPIYKTYIGTSNVVHGYLYDSDWAILILEVGYAGIAALVLLFVVLGWLAASVMRHHWSGVALILTLLALVIINFFGSGLMLRFPNAALFLLSGFVIAIAASGGTRSDDEAAQRSPG